MRITFNKKKRAEALADRGLDFKDAKVVFAGRTLDRADDREDYGEERIISVGHLHGRMVVVVWTQRGIARRVISMRKANDKEQKRLAPHFEDRE